MTQPQTHTLTDSSWLAEFFFFVEKWQEEEDAVQFANRVKSAIARQGGLVDLQWWDLASSHPSISDFFATVSFSSDWDFLCYSVINLVTWKWSGEMMSSPSQFDAALSLQGWRPEEGKGEGLFQRAAAEAVQQHGGGRRQQQQQRLRPRETGLSPLPCSFWWTSQTILPRDNVKS